MNGVGAKLRRGELHSQLVAPGPSRATMASSCPSGKFLLADALEHQQPRIFPSLRRVTVMVLGKNPNCDPEVTTHCLS